MAAKPNPPYFAGGGGFIFEDMRKGEKCPVMS
jgi:hypothetical protein